MISENISHDSIVLDPKYDNLPDIEYVDITYDIFNGVGDKKTKVDEKTCRYAQFKNNEKGILPRILMKLLSQRKATRKQILHKTITTSCNKVYTGLVVENDDTISIKTTDNSNVSVLKTDVVSNVDTYNDFMKAILDGLQLAYKITANSLYGQVGARTSPIYMKELAASTTATGRNLIMKAKVFMEEHYDADVVYGDTDSIFVDFKIKEKYGLMDKEALQKSIDISVEASDAFKKELKAPHDLEYEKTFFPFIILSKKKYVGNLYEFDVNKYKQKSMGIVLKRRDNANIVKIVYGGIIDILLKKQNISNAIEFLKTSLKSLTLGKFKIEDLVITKTLRTTYKDPSKIAHKVLADRMRDRDPGSAPQTNDRVPYVYIEHDLKNKSLLQGDKIEHPLHIIENNLNIDYIFYITNQLMKPVCQLLSVALYDIPKSSTPDFYSRKLKRYTMDYEGNVKKAKDKINDLKQKEVQKLLFDDTLTKLNNKRNKNTEITDFFKQIY
jgi:DNA polymerase elongation subunit (family B)